MNRLHRLGYLSLRAWWWITRPQSAGVRVLLERDGRVLLVKHTYRPEWHMPGGGVDKGESLEQAARREALEEVGATLGPVELLGVYSNFWNRRTDHVAVFICNDFSVSEEHDWEIAELRWFPMDALPPDLSPGTTRRLAEYREGERPGFGRW
jgi:8-oxo-dGTP pyrophosphatase MutT (NUDIX family)